MISFEAIADDFGYTINHDLINKIFGNRKNVPHEWFFVNYLYRHEFRKNQELTSAFIMFVSQFYPNYNWRFFLQNDYVTTAMCETLIHDFQFQKIYEFGSEEDQILKWSMTFGEIVTDFLIRFCNYSLIKCSGQNIIITAQSDCHKRFEELLSNGYSLQRRAKVGFIKTPDIVKISHPEVKGIFYKLPVLPTKETWYPIDEIIETEEGKYEKVMCLTKKK